MKKFTIFFITMVFMTFSAFSQDCNIGNSDGSDPDFTMGNFTPEYLLGVHFTLSEVGVLHSLNMIGNGTGSLFQMAIYNDNGGVPNNLVTYTGISTVGTGVMSLPITPVELPAGDYWIMAIYDDNGSGTNQSNVNTSAGTNVVYYTGLNFGDPIPTNASAFTSYTGQDFLYFAEISCGALSVNDFQENTVSISPNPASDYLMISNLKESTMFKIYDLTGKKLFEKELDAINNKIDVSNLAVGTYLLNYGANSVIRFVKD